MTGLVMTGLSGAGEVAWQPTSVPPVAMARFGKDHWSTFAYVETRIVDYRGELNGDHMRCSGIRHPMLVEAGRRARAVGGQDGSGYPTRLKGDLGEDGRWGVVELADHDDYDCLDDLIAAGLVSVAMPAVNDDGYFVDAHRLVLRWEGEAVPAGFITGMTEGWLAQYARFSLTAEGERVAGALRAHKGGGGNFHSFVPPVS